MPTPKADYQAHYLGIGVIALAIIAFQVLLTRLFSAMCFYHFAFVGISLAMLGLTIGAQYVFMHKKRFTPKRFEAEWVKAAHNFAVSLVFFTLAFLYMPLLWPSLAAIYMILFAVPFTFGGICIALILTKSTGPIGKLYAADLLGAALGCLGIVVTLFILDPISVAFAIALLISWAAYGMAKHARVYVKISKGLMALWLIALLIQGGLYLTDAPHIRVVWAKGHELSQPLFERWNTFSLVRVTPGGSHPFGWGFGHQHEFGPPQLSLDIDVQAGTAITGFDGYNLEPVSYLTDDIINAGYALQPINSVAIIGVGGGRDILSALSYNVKNITGIELNPSIFEALTDRFADFSGHLERRPEVKMINAEARSWIDQSTSFYDMIQVSLIDTWATTAAGGLSMSESKLYTVEAWQDFLGHLKEGGLLTVSRWYDPLKHKGEYYRLLSLAVETLKKRGVAPRDIEKHILVLGVENRLEGLGAGIVTMVLGRDELSPATLKAAKLYASKGDFDILVGPGKKLEPVSKIILSGFAGNRYYASLPLDFSAPTDDRPFFFHTARLKDMLLSGGVVADDVASASEGNLAVKVVCALLFFTFISTLYFMFVPLAEKWREIDDKSGIICHLAYFAGIGLGFMLIEISQMQRLMIFLGHPTYALTVVLFTLLLFGGIGSFVIGRVSKKWLSWSAPLALCFALGLTGYATPFFTDYFKSFDTFLRIFVSIALLAPAGFFMGMMFPLGMKASSSYRLLQSWFWSVNGATSVLGSVLGVVISMELGIAAAFWTGVCAYGFCLILVLGRCLLPTKKIGKRRTEPTLP